MTAVTTGKIDGLLDEAPFVSALARALAGGDADDVAQGTWLRAIEGGTEVLRSPRDWLTCVVRGVARNLQRGRARRRRHEHAAAARGQVPSSADLLERQELRRELLEAVNALPAPQRTVVLLRYFEGLPPRRIAVHLGVPVTTVTSRLRTALATLRQRLDARHRDRRAWLAPLLPFGDGGQLGLGVVAMTVKSKLLLAVGAMLVGALVFWGIGSQAPTVAPETNGPSVQSPTPVGARVDHETADEGVERRAVVAAAPAPTPTTGSLLVRATHRDDGSPVPELLIFVWRPGADRRIDVHRTRTDVAGEVRLTDLRPGRLLVSNSRNPYCFGRAEIVAGEEIEVGLALPVGVTITGIVVDSSDVPVAGAEVCLGGGGSREDAEGAAITGADGRFALRGCQTDFYIGARAAGYTSSVMQFVQLEEGDQRELRLLLPGAGGSVAGVVRGPTGEPVADALLAIGEAAFGRQDTTTGRALRALVRTDAEGRYRAVGVAPGEQAVRVRAAEFAPWQGTCRVDAGLTTSFDITLGAAMTVAGTVLDESGAPVGQATITIEGIDDFGHQRLESGTDGTFSIGGLQPGPVELTARHEEAGKAFLRVRGNPGQTVRCELRLDRGRVFRGRVFDEAGKPVAGVFVEAAEQIVDANEAWGGFAQSDAEGRFAIPSHPEGAQLTVTATAEGFSPFGIRDVEPERGELDIRLRAAPPKSAYLSGSVLMPDGNPAPMAELFAEAKAGGTSGTVLAQESGEFSIGPLRPGTWSLVVRVADQPTLWTGWCELPAAGTVDLGQLRLPVAGSIRVRLHGADGLEPTLAVSDPTLSHWTGLEREGDGRRSEPLVPGPHFVHVGGNGVSTRLVAVDVRAGEVSELDIELQRGRRQRFELIAPVRLDERNYRILRDGALVSGESFSTRRPGTLDPKFSCWLAPGDYTITATAHGMSGQARFAVGAGDGAPVRVFLR